MNISNEGTCRGDGKIYTRLRVKGVEDISKLHSVSASTSGDKLPSQYFLLPTTDGKEGYDLVFITPLLTKGTLENTLEVRNEDGTVVDSSSFMQNMDLAKWESRLNYRLRKGLTGLIRDYDKIEEYDRINIELIEAIEDCDQLLARIAVWMPRFEDSKLDITCFDGNGHSIAINPILLSNEVVVSSLSNDLQLRELQYSVLIPNGLEAVGFSARDTGSSHLKGFCVTEHHAYEGVLNRGYVMTCNAGIDPVYDEWFKKHKTGAGALEKQRHIVFTDMPLFSIIVPLYKTPIDLFEAMVESVTEQSYGKWELLLVNASPEDQALKSAVRARCDFDDRIIEIRLDNNLGITENTNEGIAAATGDFIVFFDHDDTIEPDILFEYAKAVNDHPDTDMLYCDEDKLTPDGKHIDAFFKPDFSIDLLRNNNFLCHMMAVRASSLATIDKPTSVYDGAQDHNVALRISEIARHIHHVPKILYHWRMTENSTAANADTKPYASKAGIRAVQEHLDRLGIPAEVSLSRRPFTYDVRYLLPDNRPLVSIVIPNKDCRPIIETCISSILQKSTYDNFEIIIVENNSTEQEIFDYYKQIESQDSRVRVVYWSNEFNFSKLINFGVQNARGDYFLLLNNDTELISPDWIERMLGHCLRSEVGAVGVRLLYKDDTVQHEGVVIGPDCGIAGHFNIRLPKSNWGFFAFGDATRNCSAVTAACLMTSKESFNAVNGFTETLAVAYNDVDFCLKLREIGKLIVYTPEVELYHYESLSRGSETDASKKLRFFKESSYIHYRWAEYYVEGDPYMNPNLCTNYFRLKYDVPCS